MNAILAKLRELQTFVTSRTITVNLNPETETVEAMVKAYFRGINHLKEAHKAFLVAKDLWQQLHGG